MSDSSNLPLPQDNGSERAPSEFEISDAEISALAAGEEGTRSPLAEAAAEAARSLGNDPRPGPRPERRRKRRAMISAPVRVRPVDATSGAPEEISTTVDVSRIGFFFITANKHYARGMGVMVTFPYSRAAGEIQAEQAGSVVRVHEMEDGRRGVAIATGPARPELVDASGRRLGKPAAQAEPLRALGAEESGAKKQTIVVVDADAAVRASMKAYLTNEGYEVIALETADDARHVLNMMTPAIVIAEIEGEGLPGYDLCAHVKTTPRLQRIPVVLTTSSAYPSDYSSAHSLGAVVCMAKPFKQERLGHVVRLLAPHPHAKKSAAPAHPPHPRRHSGGKRANPGGPTGGNRRFRIFPDI